MLIGIDASRAMTAQRTGTENYSFQLIRHLLALDPDNRYRLYFNQPPPREWRMANGELRVMPFPRLWTHLRLSWEMARHPPDLLFVPAHVLPLVHPRRSVVTVHDLGYLHYPSAHRAWDRIYLHLSTPYNARAASHVIAVSQATKRDLIVSYGISPQQITVIYHGPGQRFRPITDAAHLTAVKERYGLNGRYIIHVGTLQPRKNLVLLMDAFAEVKSQEGRIARGEKGTKLVLVGKWGWLYDQIMARVRELRLEEEVLFVGYVLQDDLVALLSGALFMVMPSLYEGFGLPVLEAMACGTPVVCSDVSSLPEVAGDAALLVDPLDVEALAKAMGQVLEDANLRAELRERGLAQARKFSWERCAQETLAVLEMAARG